MERTPDNRRLGVRIALILAGLAVFPMLLNAERARAGDRPARVRPANRGPRPSLTPELIVVLKPGQNPAQVAASLGMTVERRMRSLENGFIFRAGSTQAAVNRVRSLGSDPRFLAAYPNQRTINVRTAFVPNDPYFHKDTPVAGAQGQWHLINELNPGIDARVQGAWNSDVTGTGVLIGIADDSLQSGHPDLSPNYNAAHSWDFGQNDGVPDPVNADDQHGVSVAGVAAGRGGNSIGITGAAPLAGLAGLRIDFNTQTTAMFVDATLYHSSGTDTSIKIKNHSYGISVPFIPQDAERTALATSTAAGTIHCIAAGNDRGTTGQDANKKALQNHPDSITVAALDRLGEAAWYSNFGANVIVTSPSNGNNGGIVTTDRTGGFGYNASAGDDPFFDPPGTSDYDNYTSTFGGTSSATPLVSGVLALVKQVQPALNTRFAKHLLVRTSDVVHAGDTSVESDGGWLTNAAGFEFNPSYGFGLIDASELVTQAPLFSGVTPLQTESVGTTNVGVQLGDGDVNGVTRTFNLTGTTPLEEMLVTLDISADFQGDINAFLTSPSGTKSRLVFQDFNDLDSRTGNWQFCSNAFWGENPAGTWTLQVIDPFEFGSTTWNSYSVQSRMGELVDANTPPDAPTNLTADFLYGPSRILVTWVDQSNKAGRLNSTTSTEERFYLYRKVDAGTFAFYKSFVANTESFTDTKIQPGKVYTYKVRGWNAAAGYGPYSNEDSAQGVPPDAASNLTAAAAYGPTRIVLGWDDNSTTEERFYIYRKVGAGAFQFRASVGANIETFSDTQVTGGTEYTYQVKAWNSGGFASATNDASATPDSVPIAPNGLTAQQVAGPKVQLNWTDRSNNETNFFIYRKTSSTNYAFRGSVAANVMSFLDSGVVVGTTYTYAVKATNAAGQSPFSFPVANITIQ